MSHGRNALEITKIFSVGKRLKGYVRDGMSNELGLWSIEVLALDLNSQTVTFRLNQRLG